MLASSKWCQTCALSLGTWRKLKNKNGGLDWTLQPFVFQAFPKAHAWTLKV